MASDTRQRIVDAGSELLRLQGYNATGIKQVADEANAAFGSLYHFFPGGKEELGAAAVAASGLAYERLIAAAFDGAPDPGAGVRSLFAAAADRLADSGYADASPVATVALEVSGRSEVMRRACAGVYERWLAAAAAQLAAAGVGVAPGTIRSPGEGAVELAVALVAALEGAFVLARALRSTEPLRIAGEMVANAVDAALPHRPRSG